MTVVRGNEIGSKICRALGLDENEVLEITLSIRPLEVATIRIRMLANGAVTDVFDEYEIVHKTTPAEAVFSREVRVN